MSGKIHTYPVSIVWEGNRGTGTSGYRDFGREHVAEADGPSPIPMSSDPAFRGDKTRWNPEQIFVVSISSCHMLWYLHLAAEAGIVVTAYTDAPVGSMIEEKETGGRMTQVVLHPTVTISAGDPERAKSLHADAHHKCYIANSVSCPVLCEPVIVVAAV